MSFFGGNAAGFGRTNDDVESVSVIALLTLPPPSLTNPATHTLPLLQLFSGEPSVPVSSGGGATAPGYQPTASGETPATAFGNVTNTLDEPIWETVKRDVVRIWRNLVMVVFPFKDRSQQSAALRNWDLWGPMVFTLGLAVTLSIGAAKPSSTFSVS